MGSVWDKQPRKKHFSPLTKNITANTLIVGGGMAGILCAYMLRQRGVDCVLAEEKEICSGVTGRTTAKITFQHGLIYNDIINRYGHDAAKMYLRAQKDALEEYKKLCRNIDCDFEEKDSYVYSLCDRNKIRKEAQTLRSLGQSADVCSPPDLPFEVSGAIRVKDQAQFNPLKFAYHITADLPIYENTKIREFLPGVAKTDNAEISYKNMVIATHFPIINKHGGFFIKMHQHRSYVLALSGAQNVDGMHVDECDRGLSFRTYGDLLLLGGGAHRTGKQGGGYRELEEFAKLNYPKAKIISKWATQDCMTLDKIPYIGQYSKSMPNIYVATGFNKWGMTSSMVAANLLADLVCGKENEFAGVFSPSRSIFHPQLALNIFESMVGMLTPTVPRCPHLGCALKYNRQEHSWDCPCHGSRFSEEGKLLDNPATDDKN